MTTRAQLSCAYNPSHISAAVQISHFCTRQLPSTEQETSKHFPMVPAHTHCSDRDITHSPSADCGFSNEAGTSPAAAAATCALQSCLQLTEPSLSAPSWGPLPRTAACLTGQTVHGWKPPARFISVSGRSISLCCPSHNLCFLIRSQPSFPSCKSGSPASDQSHTFLFPFVFFASLFPLTAIS